MLVAAEECNVVPGRRATSGGGSAGRVDELDEGHKSGAPGGCAAREARGNSGGRCVRLPPHREGTRGDKRSAAATAPSERERTRDTGGGSEDKNTEGGAGPELAATPGQRRDARGGALLPPGGRDPAAQAEGAGPGPARRGMEG